MENTPPHHARAWTHVALVFVFMLVNFADKSVIGLSSVPIMRELHLSNTQFGEVGSAFFLLFSLSSVAGGFLANRFRAKTLMLWMAMLWGLALMPVSLLSSFSLLIMSRIVLGAAEGPAFPIALHAVYNWFEDRQRALPTSVVASGAAFGTGIIAPLLTWVIVRYGWHAAFGALGMTGLIWAGVWRILAKDGPVGRSTPEASSPLRIPYRVLLLSRTAIGVFIAGFGAYGVIALNITWLANYLIKALHVAPADAAWIVALPAVMQMMLAPSLAFLSQSLIRRGTSSRIARGLLGALCVVTAGLSMIGMSLLPMGPLKVFLIGLAFSVGSVIFTLGSTLIGEISPASQRGAMLGVTNSIHTLAGLCAPVGMGLIVDVGANNQAGFHRGYLYAGIIVASLGLLAAVLIEPQADLQRFRRIRRSNAGQ